MLANIKWKLKHLDLLEPQSEWRCGPVTNVDSDENEIETVPHFFPVKKTQMIIRSVERRHLPW